MPKLAAALLTLVLAAPALAHHRQTPALFRFTDSGDNALPRVTTFASAFALVFPQTAGEGPIISFDYPYPSMHSVSGGSDANPTVSSGRVVVWDADAMGTGDRQIFMRAGVLDPVQISNDPTGTSSNACTNGNGQRIAFESNGNLATTDNMGTRQIFLWTAPGITQVSRGMGTSTNPSLSRSGLRLAFQSTSDPSTGVDTNVRQIWCANVKEGTAWQVTSAPAPSYNPAISADGRLIGFESRADLAGDGHDTGHSQIYVYHVTSGNFARITEDATGCSGPSIHRFRADWRIGFVCGGQGYFYLLRAGQRFQVPIEPGGHVAGLLAELNPQFVLLSTTANLIDGGLTSDHQIYLVNLFKRPATPVPGKAFWFPEQGIP